MRWLGLAPMFAHLASAYLFFRIATIPAGYWRWWIGWAALAGGTAFYAWGRATNVFDIVWYGQTFDFTRTLTASVGATCTLTFALCMWNIFRPRPTAPPIPVAQIVMNWQGEVIEWNDAARDLLGWTREEAYKTLLADLIIPEGLMVTYEDRSIPAREAHRLGLERFRLTGESAIMNTFFYTTAQHKDGRLLELEVRVTAHMSGMRQTFLGQLTLKPKLIV